MHRPGEGKEGRPSLQCAFIGLDRQVSAASGTIEEHPTLMLGFRGSILACEIQPGCIMTAHQLTVPVSGDASAFLILPQPLTPESLGRLELGLAVSLAQLRIEMGGDATDPGSLEYESWMQHLHPTRA